MSDKIIEDINNFIKKSENTDLIKLLPITKRRLYEDEELCDEIVNYLSNQQMYLGFDINYNETKIGKTLSEMIDFIVLCGEKLI